MVRLEHVQKSSQFIFTLESSSDLTLRFAAKARVTPDDLAVRDLGVNGFLAYLGIFFSSHSWYNEPDPVIKHIRWEIHGKQTVEYAHSNYCWGNAHLV